MASTTAPSDQVPQLIHQQTLKSPSIDIRAWSSTPHPDPNTPLLATATSDKAVNIWDMRSWKLVSTISGGHKRSIRCVSWKDYGTYHKQKKRKTQASTLDTLMDDNENDDMNANTGRKDPVLLATGSFDANTGLWVWNRDFRSSAAEMSALTVRDQDRQRQVVPGGFADEDDEEQERDFTMDAPQRGEEDENEEWHFSTLLTGPDSEIKDVKFSPAHYGANLLATCSRDKSVWVWEEVEPEEWETIAVMSEHVGDVKCLDWCRGARTTKSELQRRLDKRRTGTTQASGTQEGQPEDNMVISNGTTQTQSSDSDADEDLFVGSREVLASGSYDDTIRLYHDDEAEGDWICIAALSGHDGTVWDLKFEPHISLSSYPADTSAGEVLADWTPRIISCSDDLTVRIWRKQLNDKERAERAQRIESARQQHQISNQTGQEGAEDMRQMGFGSSRIPNSMRIGSSTEVWTEEAKLPSVHLRSIYALDWSARTGLVVTCGGDGAVAVYKEVPISAGAEAGLEDTVMANGDENHESSIDEAMATIKKVSTEWKVVARIEAAHDVYEVNHVCWALKRDSTRRQELHSGQIVDDADSEGTLEEEYIVTTGDDGDVRVWKLPDEVLKSVS